MELKLVIHPAHIKIIKAVLYPDKSTPYTICKNGIPNKNDPAKINTDKPKHTNISFKTKDKKTFFVPLCHTVAIFVYKGTNTNIQNIFTIDEGMKMIL